MKIRLVPVFLTLLVTILFCQSLVPLADAASMRKVVILDIPRLNLAEITPDYPHLTKLLETGAAGLVTIPTIYSVQPAQVYLYFNSGAFLKIPRGGLKVYDATETVNRVKAGTLYEDYTGTQVTSGAAICTDILKLIKLNPQVDLSNPGLIGALLHQNAIKTAVIGNTDTPRLSRSGATLVMDEKGIIDFGAIGPETLRRDPRFPVGVRTNPDQILKYFRLFREQAGVIVLTLGDLERIESCRDNFSQSRRAHYRGQVLQRYDRLLSSLMRDIEPQTTLLMILTCLQPEQPGIKSNTLTPVILLGAGFQPGILYSKSTRKKALVTYGDLRNLIIKYLTTGIQPISILTSIPGRWRTLIAEEESLVKNYSARWPLLTLYGVLLVCLTILTVIGLIFHFQPQTMKSFAWSYLFLLTIPATFLLEALVNPLHWVPIIFLTLGISAVLFLGVYYLAGHNLLKALAWISFITCILVLGDGLFGGYCESKSFLGYTAVSGKRYYGIGNEYMGVLLGAYIVGISLYLRKLPNPQPILWLFYGLTCLVFFHPGFGADVGGGITAVLGLGITNFLWLKKPVRIKEAGLLLLLMFLTLASIGVWDSLAHQSSATHFGQLLQNVVAKGFNSVITITWRKVDMNWRLIQYTPLTFVLIGILFIVPVIYQHPSSRIKSFIAAHPEISRGLVGLNYTALIGFLANDSGIVAAATMFLFGLAMLLVTLIQAPSSLITDSDSKN